jgi:hypothetical protein
MQRNDFDRPKLSGTQAGKKGLSNVMNFALLNQNEQKMSKSSVPEAVWPPNDWALCEQEEAGAA